MAAAPLSWVAQVAGAAVFLASDEPAAITGILVSVTSGDAPARRGRVPWRAAPAPPPAAGRPAPGRSGRPGRRGAAAGRHQPPRGWGRAPAPTRRPRPWRRGGPPRQSA